MTSLLPPQPELFITTMSHSVVPSPDETEGPALLEAARNGQLECLLRLLPVRSRMPCNVVGVLQTLQRQVFAAPMCIGLCLAH